MNIDKQIILSLFIIVFIQMLILVIIIRKLSITKKVKDGIDLGDKIPYIQFEDANGNIGVINSDFLTNIGLLLFLDTSCNECSKVINSLNVINKKYLNKIKIVFVKSENNFKKIVDHYLKDYSIFIETDIMFNNFKINGFPFFVKFDSNGKVTDKGYVSKYNLIDYVTNI